MPEEPPVEFEHTMELTAEELQAERKSEQLLEQVALHMPLLPNVQSGPQVRRMVRVTDIATLAPLISETLIVQMPTGGLGVKL